MPANIKQYIRTTNGGYSTCIKGKPTYPTANVLSNCVGYACGRFNEIIGGMKYPALNCNAENFIERAITLGLQVVSKPSLGGIMVWQKGATLSGNDGAGHVEVVERIDSENQIYTSASNYGGTTFYNSLKNNSNGRWGLARGYTYRGCIVNPAIGYKPYEPAPTPTPTKSIDEVAREVIRGDWGNQPKRQKRLEAAGYNYAEVQGRVNEILAGDKPAPTPSTELKKGDRVRIIGRGNANSYGTGNSTGAKTIGWEREVLDILDGRLNPIRVGNSTGTTGWFKASNLKKI